MTPKERVLNVLRNESADRKPVSSVTQVGIVEAMEKTGAFWPDAQKDPEKMATLGAALYKLAGLETARIPFCLTVLAEAMGCEVDLGGIEKTPSVKKPAFYSIESMDVPLDYLSKGRIPTVLSAVKILKKSYDILPIIVGMEGPYTLIGHLFGIENILKWTLRQPAAVTKALDFALKANVEYAKILIESGADVICVADPSASPELMSPKDFSTLMLPRLRELATAINSRGCASVLHICGGVNKIIKDMAETGFSGLSVEEKVDLIKAKQDIGTKAKLIGNIAASKVLFMGTPEIVTEEGRKAIAAGIDILAPGCGLVPITPLENIKALVRSVEV